MAQVRERTVADLERVLREARARLAEGERELRATRARLEVFAKRYHDTVGQRFEILKKLQSAAPAEDLAMAESTPATPAARERAPGHGEFERLYRDLARRMHPDLARDADDRAVRTRVMAELNLAREALDFERARRIGDAWDLRPEEITADPTADHGERLLMAIERVEARLTAVAADLVRLRESDLHVLMEMVAAQDRAGNDVLGDTAADLDVQIAEARTRMALAHRDPAEISRPQVRPSAVALPTPVRPTRQAVVPLGLGVFLAGSIALLAAFLGASPRNEPTIVTVLGSATRPSGAPAPATPSPLSYAVAERQVSATGRTTATVRIVVVGTGSVGVLQATLAEAARREIRSQQAIVVYAYRSATEIGGPFTVGRAYLTVDGKGWGGDGLTEDGPDTGGVVGSVVVALGAVPETRTFDVRR